MRNLSDAGCSEQDIAECLEDASDYSFTDWAKLFSGMTEICIVPLES